MWTSSIKRTTFRPLGLNVSSVVSVRSVRLFRIQRLSIYQNRLSRAWDMFITFIVAADVDNLCLIEGFELQNFLTTVSSENQSCASHHSIRIVLISRYVNIYDYHGAYVTIFKVISFISLVRFHAACRAKDYLYQYVLQQLLLQHLTLCLDIQSKARKTLTIKYLMDVL